MHRSILGGFFNNKHKLIFILELQKEFRDYEDSNKTKDDLFYCAVVSGNKGLVKLIFNFFRMDERYRGKYFVEECLNGYRFASKYYSGNTILHVCCDSGRSDILDVLLSESSFGKYIDFEECFSVENNRRQTPLTMVFENGDITLFEWISNNVDFIKKEDFERLLSYAAFNGRRAFVKYCLDAKGFSIESADIYQRSLLFRAVEAREFGIVDDLTAKGARYDTVDCINHNLLHALAMSDIRDNKGCERFFNKFLEVMGPDKTRDFLNMFRFYTGVENTFLVRGRDKGRDAWHYVEVGYCLIPGFRAKTKSGNVDVKLYGDVFCSGWGLDPSVEEIKSVECEFKERRLKAANDGEKHETPLHFACFKERVFLVKKFIEHGAEVDAANDKGVTPLMVAAAKGNQGIVNILKKAGADVYKKNKHGETAYDIAKKNSVMNNEFMDSELINNELLMNNELLESLSSNPSDTFQVERP